MSEYQYPEFNMRSNYLAGMYCEIAMESYYEAITIYDEIKAGDFSGYYIEKENIMNKKIINTIVFAAMCIESFLNNFAASAMGDSNFYDSFDKLSVISKFQLIAKFILGIDVDKSKSNYCYLKELFKQRDSFVHNKSKQCELKGYSEEEYKEVIKNLNDSSESMNFEIPPLQKDEITNDIKNATNALKAIKEIADIFDENDSNVNSLITLFNPNGIIYGNDCEKSYKNRVFSMLGIKVDTLL